MNLKIGGCDVCELVKLSPYPIYVLDEALLRKKMRTYVRSLKEGTVYYASKAMMNSAICKIAEQENMGLDISSGGELYTALQANFPMEKLIFHGNNKSKEELVLALQQGVGRIAVDNFDEIALLQEVVEELKTVCKVLVRVTPGIHADTHRFVMTGQEDSKFGFPIHDGSAFQAIQKLISFPKISFKGIHCHIGSQILNLEGFEKAIEVVARFCQTLKTPVKEFNFGGGLGVKYLPDDQPIPIETYIQAVSSKIREEFLKKNLTAPKVLLEPGRSIIAEAGTTLYTIGSIKEMKDGLYLAAVNGGMADNIRPPLYGALYHAVLANRIDEKPLARVKIVGKCCESGDVLIQEILMPKPKRGDILAVFTTGAYNYSMASNYNRLPIPGILLVKEGKYDWIVVPQDLKDLVRNDRIPSYLS